jgi:hypothetical protein
MLCAWLSTVNIFEFAWCHAYHGRACTLFSDYADKRAVMSFTWNNNCLDVIITHSNESMTKSDRDHLSILYEDY